MTVLVGASGVSGDYTEDRTVIATEARFNVDGATPVASGEAVSLTVATGTGSTAIQAALYKDDALVDTFTLAAGASVQTIAFNVSHTVTASSGTYRCYFITESGTGRIKGKTSGATMGQIYSEAVTTYGTPADPREAGAYEAIAIDTFWQVNGTSGPSITSTTDPIAEGDTVTTVLDTADSTVETTRITAGGYTDTFAASSGDDTNWSSTYSPTTLPFIGACTVALWDDTAEIDSIASTLESAYSSAVVVASAVTDDPAYLGFYLKSGSDPLADGCQIEIDGDNTTCAADTLITQTAQEVFRARAWNISDGSRGPWATFKIIGGRIVPVSLTGVGIRGYQIEGFGLTARGL